MIVSGENRITFESTGREAYVYDLMFSLGMEPKPYPDVCYGYDGLLRVDSNEEAAGVALNRAERGELAEHMAKRWVEWGELRAAAGD